MSLNEIIRSSVAASLVLLCTAPLSAEPPPTIESCLDGEVGRATHFCLEKTGRAEALPLIFEVAGQYFETLEPGDRLPRDFFDAARNAGRLAARTDVALLFQWSAAEQATTRAFGLHALGSVIDVVEDDEDADVRALSERAADGCAAALADPESLVVEHALACLGHARDGRHARAIVQAVIETGDPALRRKGCSTLRAIRDLDEVAGELRPLIQVLEQPFPNVSDATWVRGEICGLLRTRIRDGETWAAAPALAAVEHIGDRNSQVRQRCLDLAEASGADVAQPPQAPRTGRWFRDAVISECSGEDLGERHLMICARSEPGPDHSRAFAIELTDPSRVDPTGEHVVLRRVELEAAVDEYLDLDKVSAWELSADHRLLFAPLVTGTPDDYSRGRTLLYLLDAQHLQLRHAWTSPPCPDGCSWQTLSTSRHPDVADVEITYTATAAGSRASTRLIWNGRDLVEQAMAEGASSAARPAPPGTGAPFAALAEMRTVPDRGWVDVSAGANHTCARDGDGRVACWGNDGNGQCRTDGRCVEYTTGMECTDGALHGSPCQTDADCEAAPFSAVSAGYSSSCAVHDSGRLRCWGAEMRRLRGTMAGVSLGFHQQCALRADGTVTCLGNADWAPEGAFVQLDAGSGHTCAVRADGSVACWGDTEHGQTEVPPGLFAQVSAGGAHSCGIANDLAILCWGSDQRGQSSPPGGRFIQVVAGHEHTCGLRPDGAVECWGFPSLGVCEPPAEPMAHISAGRYHTCGITTDGQVLCWGSNDRGQCDVP
jgi:hypothetical protein